MTDADLIRDYARAHPEYRQAAIAADLGVSRQAVSRALRSTSRMGRPPKPLCTHCHGTGHEPTTNTGATP